MSEGAQRMAADVGAMGVVVLSRLLDPPPSGLYWSIGELSDGTGLPLEDLVAVLVEDLPDRILLGARPHEGPDPEACLRAVPVMLPLDPDLEGLDAWVRSELDGAGLPDPGLEGIG